MEFNLSANINEDIPIIIERCEEDATSFIERSFQRMKQQEKLGKNEGIISDDLKYYIENIVKTHLNSKTKREIYYEHELIKSFKDRIVFLEEEIRLKNKLIDNLINSTVTEFSQSVFNNKTDFSTNHTEKNKNKDLSFPPE